MLQADHLDWNSDKDCIRIAECVIDWLTSDGPDYDPATTVKELIIDLLQCVTDPQYSAHAQELCYKIGA